MCLNTYEYTGLVGLRSQNGRKGGRRTKVRNKGKFTRACEVDEKRTKTQAKLQQIDPNQHFFTYEYAGEVGLYAGLVGLR